MRRLRKGDRLDTRENREGDALAAGLPSLEQQTPGLDAERVQQTLQDAEAYFGEHNGAHHGESGAGTTRGATGISAGRAAAFGLLAGVAGVAAMTAGEKVEQVFTHRPNSFVPAHTLERLLRLPHRPDGERRRMNWVMHWGQGIMLGAVRGGMAARGIRGPVGSFLFMGLRLLNDQTLENATSVGSPPWTWPVDEQVIDLLHKAVYAFATGAVADRLITGPPGVPAPRIPWTERTQ